MAGEIKEVKDVEKAGPSGVVKRWFMELSDADAEERTWRRQATLVESRYRDQGRYGDKTGGVHTQFNILWSITQILHAAIFSGNPEPDVRRTFIDEDEGGKNAAIVLERGIKFSKDSHDFNSVISDVTRDYLLPGRGQARVRYIPTLGEAESQREAVTSVQTFEIDEAAPRRFVDGEGQEFEDQENEVSEDDDGLFRMRPGEASVEHEEVISEYVPWDDYRQSPAKRWEDVRWVAFRTYMTRKEMETQFGSVGKDVLLIDAPPAMSELIGDNEIGGGDSTFDSEAFNSGDGIFQRALVWEIWDRDSGQMIIVSPGLMGKPIFEGPAPIRFKNFFPCPRPILSVASNRTQIPIPEYSLYQDQAIELDRLTSRITKLIEATLVRGVYDGRFKEELKNMFKISESELLPLQNWQSLLEKGGLAGIIDWVPTEKFAEAVAILLAQRAEVIKTIYDITGVSDIFRGATDPRETLGAQRLKSQFGTLRLRPRQDEVERFVRDIFRLMAEVIGEEFSPETISRMVGTDVVTAEEMPEVMQIISDDGERGFRVDVETDTTVAADDAQAKQDATEFMAAVGKFYSDIVVPLQIGAITAEQAQALVAFNARRFKMGREVEDLLKAPETPPQPAIGAGDGTQGPQGAPQGQEDPGAAQGAADAQKMDLAADAQQIDATMKTRELDLKERELELKEQGQQMDRMKMENDDRFRMLELQVKSLKERAA